MPRSLLCALALAGACSAPEAPAAARLAPAARAPAAECPAPGVLAAPYERPGDRRQQIDDLTFWGWSRDGRTFAYETFDAGPGAATCEGAVGLYVVDADSGATITSRELRPAHPDREPCEPPDLRAAMAAERAALLERHGIEVGNLLAPAEPLRSPDPGPGVKAYTILLPSGKTAVATLEVRHGDRERAFEGQGAAFELDLAAEGQPPLVLETGDARSPYVWNYDLDRGLVFVSPDGARMALMVAATRLSFEGDRTTWIARAFTIPSTW